MSFNFKSKIVIVDEKNTVTSIAPSPLPVGGTPYLVALDIAIKIGDTFDGVTVTPDPDAAKKALLEAERLKALAALQDAESKTEILKALTDATAAVQPLEDVVKP